MPTEQLILKINVKGGKTSQRDINNAVQSAEKLKKAFHDAQAAGNSPRWKRIEVNMRGIEKSVKNTERSVSLLTRTFRSLAGLHVLGRAFSFFARMAQDVAHTADAYTLLKNRIRAVVTDMSEVGAVTKEILDLTIRSRTPLVETAQIYSRLAVASRDLGLSQRETINITETLSQTVKLSGAATQEGSKALIQFTQALASNRFSADELRSVTEQLPRLADIIARHLGITRGELKEWGEAGKLTTDVMVEALQNAAQEIDREFTKLIPTMSESWEVLTTVVKEFVGELDASAGISESFSVTMLKMAEELRGAIVPFKDLAFVLGEINTGFGDLSDLFSASKMTENIAATVDFYTFAGKVLTAPYRAVTGGELLPGGVEGIHALENKLKDMRAIRTEAERLEAAFGGSGITDGINLEDQGIDRTPAAKKKRKKGRSRKPFTLEDAMRELEIEKQLAAARKPEREAAAKFLQLKKRLTTEISDEQEKELMRTVWHSLDTDRKLAIEDQENFVKAVKEQAEASKLVNKLLDEEMEKIREKEAMAQKMRDAIRVVMANRYRESSQGKLDSPWVEFDDDGNVTAREFKTTFDHLGELLGPSGPIISGIDSMNKGLAETVAHAIVFGDSTKEWQENLRNVARTIQMQLVTSLLSLPGQIVTDSIRNSISGSVANSATSAIGTAAGSALTGRKHGGYTGNYGVNDIVGYHHGQEFVMPAEQTRKFRSELESMKSGNSPSNKSASGVNMQVNVINQAGSNLDFETKVVDEKTVEIIAKRQVEKHAEKIVAGAISNPYSKTSKALGRHTNTRRVR